MAEVSNVSTHGSEFDLVARLDLVQELGEEAANRV